MFRCRIFYVLLLVCTVSVSARERDLFVSVGARDGLPNSSVAAIVQDSRGFLWFGTQGGLVRYDGYTFKLLENEPFKKNTLPHDQIQSLFEDGQYVWIGTYGGLSRYDIIADTFTNYRHDPQDTKTIRNNLILSIRRDKNGALWVGTAGGLDRMDESTGRFTRFTDDTSSGGLPAAMIRDLELDSAGNFWAAVQGHGLFQYIYDEKRFEPFQPDPKNSRSLPGANIMSITEDSAGSIWVGIWGSGIARLDDIKTKTFTPYRLEDERIYFVEANRTAELDIGTWGAGLFVFSTTDGSVQRYVHDDGYGSIPHNVVYSTFRDAHNVMWFGTNGGGLAYAERNSQRYKMFSHTSEKARSLPGGKVTSLLEDSSGRLWAAVYAGGLSLLDRKTGTVTRFTHNASDPNSLPNDIINYMYEDSLGSIWIATNDGLSMFLPETGLFKTYRPDSKNPNSIADSVVYSIAEDTSGNLWIGTYTKGLNYFNRSTGTFTHYPSSVSGSEGTQDSLIYALCFDADGALWIGCNNGVDRYINNTFHHYKYDIDNKNGISSNTVRNIFLDSQDRLWLGTVGGGLMLYNYKKNTFSHITKDDGMPHNTVRSIVESDNNQIWVGTAKGLGVVDVDGMTAKGFSVYNDLMDTDFHTGGVKGKNGLLYFGGQNAVYEVDPSFVFEDRPLPRALISDITVNGRPISYDRRFSSISASERSGLRLSSLKLKHNENNFAVSFATIDFREPRKNMYSYKLEGFDTEWSHPSSVNIASYTNLSGGKYTLRIRASDNDGYWNNDAVTLPVTVSSPPWFSVPAFVFYLLLLVGAGYIAASLRGKKMLYQKFLELTRLQSELQAANERLDDLSMKDGLTGLANRRRLDSYLSVCTASSYREKQPLSVLMVDIDFFKGYNDMYGHLMGDETLKKTAEILSSVTERATDLAARFGGEEFVLVLPNTDYDGAFTVAQKILSSVESLKIPNGASEISSFLTVSAGIASAVPDSPTAANFFLDTADTYLYKAKQAGRNCVKSEKI